MSSFVVYAPNLRTGGGRQLLLELIGSCPLDLEVSWVLPDNIPFPPSGDVYLVPSGILSRLKSELILRSLTKPDSTTICFNGSAPFFKLKGSVHVYLQNRLLLQPLAKKYPLKTYFRLFFEKNLLRFRWGCLDVIYVQTSSMFNAVNSFIKINRLNDISVKVLPFVSGLVESEINFQPGFYDGFRFFYPADFLPHKNHIQLCRAFIYLSEMKYSFDLFLTIDTHELNLIFDSLGFDLSFFSNIHAVGSLKHEDVLSFYKTSSALIFPSTVESFGLPLIEASQLGVPIIASEMDYVRDVCEPAETFDPMSYISIARSVLRFAGLDQPPCIIPTGSSFWGEVE